MYLRKAYLEAKKKKKNGSRLIDVTVRSMCFSVENDTDPMTQIPYSLLEAKKKNGSQLIGSR